jgi:hypothetical protein
MQQGKQKSTCDASQGGFRGEEYTNRSSNDGGAMSINILLRLICKTSNGTKGVDCLMLVSYWALSKWPETHQACL